MTLPLTSRDRRSHFFGVTNVNRAFCAYTLNPSLPCLQDNPCKHPVVILKDVNQDDVKALLNFVYQGTVYISEKKLASFLRTAELLQIRGLAGAASTINTDLVSARKFC